MRRGVGGLGELKSGFGSWYRVFGERDLSVDMSKTLLDSRALHVVVNIDMTNKLAY